MKFSFLILFFLVLSGTGESAQEPTGEIPNEQKIPSAKVKTPSQDQRQAGAPTAFENSLVESLRTIADQQKADYEQRRAEQESWWSPPRIQFGLLVVGFAYTIFACLQWRAIRWQVNLERPWMMFRPENPNMWPLPNVFSPSQNLLIVPWNIINVGRSPAFLTRLIARMEIVDRDRTPPRLPRGTDFPNYIISPKGPPEDRHGDVLQRRISQKDFDDLKNGTTRIWVYGIAEYRGIRRRPHITRFCCLWYVENGNSVYDPVGPKGWTKYT